MGAAAALAAAAASAHPGRPGVFEAHDHRTRGGQWHVELTLAHDVSKVKNLVVYSERCEETMEVSSAPVSPAGEVSVAIGSLSLDAKLEGPAIMRGSFTISTPACSDTNTFTLRRKKRSGGHVHVAEYGDPRDATERDKRLWRATLRDTPRRFPTYQAARRAGFRRTVKDAWKRPLVFHLRHDGYNRDRNALDPKRPESLVYWWPARGRPVLIGVMYRAPAGGRVPRGILQWHRHAEDGHLGVTKMTHIWLTGGIASAAATCLPVPQLEREVRRFRYRWMGTYGAMETRPCPR